MSDSSFKAQVRRLLYGKNGFATPSRKAEISQEEIQRLLNDPSGYNPDMKIIRKIARAFEKDLAELDNEKNRKDEGFNDS